MNAMEWSTLTGFEDGHQSPLTSNQHHHRNRSLLVHIYGHGSFCRTIPFRVQCSLLSPTFCCTNLGISKSTKHKSEIDDVRYFQRGKWIHLWTFGRRRKLTAFEARLVEFVSSSNTFFSSVDWFAALWAFWVFYWYERHLVISFGWTACEWMRIFRYRNRSIGSCLLRCLCLSGGFRLEREFVVSPVILFPHTASVLHNQHRSNENCVNYKNLIHQIPGTVFSRVTI